MAGKYKTYSPEFKEEAARLVIDTSRPIADVARELQITETSLGNWVRAYREKHAEEEPPLQVSERARLRELERRNRELEMELAFLKKAAGGQPLAVSEQALHRRRIGLGVAVCHLGDPVTGELGELGPGLVVRSSVPNRAQ